MQCHRCHQCHQMARLPNLYANSRNLQNKNIKKMKCEYNSPPFVGQGIYCSREIANGSIENEYERIFTIINYNDDRRPATGVDNAIQQRPPLQYQFTAIVCVFIFRIKIKINLSIVIGATFPRSQPPISVCVASSTDFLAFVFSSRDALQFQCAHTFQYSID